MHPKITAANLKLSRGLCQDRALGTAPSKCLNGLWNAGDQPGLPTSSGEFLDNGDFQPLVGMDTFDLLMSFISEREQGRSLSERCSLGHSPDMRAAMPGLIQLHPMGYSRQTWAVPGNQCSFLSLEHDRSWGLRCKGSSYKGGINCN